MGKVTILRGIPGAGKSTYAATLDACKNTCGMDWCNHYFVCSADKYFETPTGYVFDKYSLNEAHSWCLKQFIIAIRGFGHTNIVVDNTNITGVEIAPYHTIATAFGYECEIITLKIPHELAHTRNVHGVPLKTCKYKESILDVEASRFPKHWKHKVIS